MQCGLFIQMSEYLVDDHRVFDTSVRRIGDDLYPPATRWADFDIDPIAARSNTRFNRCYHAPVTTRLLPRA
jgi:hypothetical protein